MNMKAPKQVLVTGGNGFIGKRLMEYLKDQGTAVVGVDLRGDGNDVQQGDIGDPKSIAELLATCDVVIHAAALVSNAISDTDMWQANVLATARLVAAAAEVGVKRFVHISSIVSYGNSAEGELDELQPVHADGGSYVLTKLAAEHAVLQAQASQLIETVIVRLGDVYGPGSRPWIIEPIEAIRKNQFALPAKGKGLFRPVYIDDVVRGIALAAVVEKAGGEVINLSCKGCITTAEYFSNHCQWLGKGTPKLISTRLALLLAKIVSAVSALTGKPNELTPATIYQLSTKSWYSIEKAERILGWKPEVELALGLQESRQWAQQQGLL